MIETNKREIARQLIHLSGVGSVFFALKFGKFITGTGALVISVGLFILSFYVKLKHEIRKMLPLRIKFIENIEDSFHELLNSVEREETKIPYMGAILFFAGIGISFLVFPLKIGILATIVLSVGDSISTLIGVHVGAHKIKINPKKSWEGTLSGLLGAFAVCSLFTNPLTAFIASLTGMIIEFLPIEINDNLLIPFTVGFVLLGTSMFFPV